MPDWDEMNYINYLISYVLKYFIQGKRILIIIRLPFFYRLC
jgi:hypothetical protein